ncbi:MAG: hypothetical protein WA790_08885 [Sulfitobacter sp.]
MAINVGRTTLPGGADKKTYRDPVNYDPGTELQMQFQQYPGPDEKIVQAPDLLRCTVEVLGDDPFDEEAEKGWHQITTGEDAPDLDSDFLIRTFTLPARMGTRLRGGNVRAVITRPDTYVRDADYRVRVGPVPSKTGGGASKKG